MSEFDGKIRQITFTLTSKDGIESADELANSIKEAIGQFGFSIKTYKTVSKRPAPGDELVALKALKKGISKKRL